MDNLPLREKKFARTKVSITFYVIEKLLHTSLDSISVKEICREVEISEATFFNYFPKKTDIIDYYTSLRMFKIFWLLQKKTNQSNDPIVRIRCFFDIVAENFRPAVFNEIFCFYFKNKQYDNMNTKISASEKIIAFPECEGIETIPKKNTAEFFSHEVTAAVEKNIFKQDTDIVQIVTILHIILYGSLIYSHTDPKNSLKDYYETQLNSTFESLTPQ